MFSNYENPVCRGLEEPPPWNIQAEIARLCHKHYQVLDVGCGTLFKWQKLKDRVATLTGLDRSSNMRSNAIKNIRQWQDNKVRLVHGDSHFLPFADSSFNMVTAIMSPCANESEVFRVLKPGGVFFMESSTEMDNRSIKEAFGKDEEGWRGQHCDTPEGDVIRQRTDCCERLFGNCQIRHAHWRVWYKKEHLKYFLEQTPVIRDYGKSGDNDIVDTLINNSPNENGFESRQDRILLVAHKSLSAS